MAILLHDLMIAWRHALHKPASALLIVATLAFGIGANAAMFSMAYRVLLAPLPYEQAERLVKLEQNAEKGTEQDLPWSVPTFEDFARLDEVFAALLQYEQFSYSVIGAAEPYLAQTGIVSWNFFAELGIVPRLGRAFVAADEAADARQVLLLSHEFWLSQLGANPNAVGMTLEVQGVAREVVGVLPPMAPYPHRNDIWITAANDPFRIYMGSDMSADRENTFPSHVFGRLREGVTRDDAAQAAEVLSRRLAAAYPDIYADDYTVAVRTLREEMLVGSRLSFVLLLVLAALVLLIASANVASLNLARIADRSQELTVREALGASPARIVRHLLTESLFFALVGGVIGLLFAWPCLRLLSAFAAGYTPLAFEVGMDASLLVAAFVISVLTGIVSGTFSAGGKRDINSALKDGGDKLSASTGRVQRRRALLFMQFAMAFVTLTVTALVVLSLHRLSSRELGYDPDRILALSTQFDISPDEPFDSMQQRFRIFINRLRQELSAVPGVEAVGILGGSPIIESSRAGPRVTSFEVEGLPLDSTTGVEARFNNASPGFFDMMGIPLRSGRLFSEQDDADSLQVAIVNTRFVELFIPDGNALGKRIHVRGDPSWKTIVGVVANISSEHLDQPEPAAVYYNLQQRSAQTLNIYARSALAPAELGRNLTEVIHRIEPLQTVQNLGTLDEIKAAWLAPSSLRAALITLFGLLALVLTLAGVVGVMSCNSRQRVREIGIRMAIGATPKRVAWLFIKDGLLICAAGVALGLGMMLFVAPLLQPLLYETSAYNAGVWFAIATLLTLAALCASWWPASRAALLNPTLALRAE